ncbi:GreA/GreB family elongation factor [Chloroflexota bacterium]
MASAEIKGRDQSLEEAVTRYLSSLPPEKRTAKGQELNSFARWFGRDRAIAELTPPEVAKYAEQTTSTATNPAEKLEPVRAFLSQAKKEGLLSTNLATHLRSGKASTKRGMTSVRTPPPEAQFLTLDGYAGLEAELEALKKKRSRVVEELRQAAADKDFRENAPLDAAREERGRFEARISELEAILKSATVAEERPRKTSKVLMGQSIVIQDLDSGEELRYTLVHPREMDLARGRVSIASPLGKALLGREKGEIIEVTAPAGTLRYQIEKDEL